mgnify:CR=1 FL=1
MEGDMLRDLIYRLGIRAVARECGVYPGAVRYWAEHGLPDAPGHAKKRQRYERVLARMAGMRVGELRDMIRQEEGQAA